MCQLATRLEVFNYRICQLASLILILTFTDCSVDYNNIILSHECQMDYNSKY